MPSKTGDTIMYDIPVCLGICKLKRIWTCAFPYLTVMGLLVVWFPKTLYGTQDVIFRVGVYGAAVVLVMNTFFVSQKIRFQRLIENFECMFGKVYAPLHCDMLDHVLKTVPKGDATRVLEAMDNYAKEHWMMNVGDVKGDILESVIKEHGANRIKVAVEFGGFCGYSVVRLASVLPNARIYTVEPNPVCSAVQSRIISHAGNAANVEQVYSYSKDFIVHMATQDIKADFVFMDHHKRAYKPDLVNMVHQKLLKRGALIIADNALNPGAPELKAYIQKNEGILFRHRLIDTFLEYSDVVPDQLLVAEYLG